MGISKNCKDVTGLSHCIARHNISANYNTIKPANGQLNSVDEVP